MNRIVDRLTIEEHHGKKISFADYTGLKGNEMIELIKLHLDLTLKEKIPFIADYHHIHITSEYVQQARKFADLTKTSVDKAAFLGVTQVQSWILKGVVMLFNLNYKAFDSREEAIKFITTDDSGQKNGLGT